MGMALAWTLVLLYITVQVRGYCYLTKAVHIRMPVYCEKGEYCCGSGRHKHCCNTDKSNLYAPLAIGLGIGIPVVLVVVGLVVILCVKGKLRCPIKRPSDRTVNYSPTKSGETS
ncbi:uncharacterized protein [Haliotis cracherodii]|uniref:uncharacterized protein n=1 Tax=Haliotis cracherodii TaxID=6455 RepID=UPI0039EA9347